MGVSQSQPIVTPKSAIGEGGAAAAVPAAPRPAVPSTCIEHQAGRPTLRLSFQIKVF